MGKVELMEEAFGLLNAYKRHRALHNMRETATQDRQFHELQMYKKVDQLELALRAIQKEIREGDKVTV